MIVQPLNTSVRMLLRRTMVSRFRSPVSGFKILASYFLLLTSSFFLSCNQPFQPEVKYNPRLNIYSILFANAHGAYVRVMAVTESPGGVSMPVHGATVKLSELVNGLSTTYDLKDTTEVTGPDTISYYYTGERIIPGRSYTVSVVASGYPPVNSSLVTVPFGFAALPTQAVYSFLRDPAHATPNTNLDINLSSLASAAFVQIFVEYRGLDESGKFHVGSFSVLPIDSLNPYTEVVATRLPVVVDSTRYRKAFTLARAHADSLTLSHMYVNVIVTQIDDNLYRYFVTSLRSAAPLIMRTDKIIFSNITDKSGTGIVSGASVDTTRIFLF